MSRSRNIKPGFFKNDVLAECEPLARILFAGLWCEADREGRLEDRPKKIRAECLPYDVCDIDFLLDQLANHGFILRYEVGGTPYIQVLAFDKHQNPHKNESASTIPAPELHSTSTVQVPNSSEALRLIPDSLNLIPDSKEKKGAGDKSPPLVLPDWLPDEVWADWHKYRNSRKGWTAKAKELSLRTLTDLWAQGHDPRLIVNKSIECGWSGLFPPKSGPPSGPIGQVSKTLGGLQRLEELKNVGLAERRNLDRATETYLLELGPNPGDGFD